MNPDRIEWDPLSETKPDHFKEGTMVLAKCGYAVVAGFRPHVEYVYLKTGEMRRKTYYKYTVKSLNDLTFVYDPAEIIPCTINDMSDSDKVKWIAKLLD